MEKSRNFVLIPVTFCFENTRTQPASVRLGNNAQAFFIVGWRCSEKGFSYERSSRESSGGSSSHDFEDLQLQPLDPPRFSPLHSFFSFASKSHCYVEVNEYDFQLINYRFHQSIIKLRKKTLHTRWKSVSFDNSRQFCFLSKDIESELLSASSTFHQILTLQKLRRPSK